MAVSEFVSLWRGRYNEVLLYGKCSKTKNSFFFLCLVFGTGIHKMLVRIANR